MFESCARICEERGLRRPQTPRTGRVRRRAGFTLVEVLVAATVSIVLVVSLTAVLSSFLSTARRSDNRADAFREGRAAIQFFQRDIQSLVRAENKASFLALSDLALTQRGGPSSSEPRGGDEVHVLAARLTPAAAAKDDTKDEVMAVSFFTKWNADDCAFELRRRVVKPRETLKRLRDSYAASTDPKLAKPAAVFAAGGSGNADVADELLATFVWDLRVHAYNASGVEIKFPDPSSPPYPLVWHATEFLTPNPPPIPAFVEVSFKALSPAAGRAVAATLRSRTPAAAGDFWFTPSKANATEADKRLFQSLVTPGLQVFHVRIPVSTP